MLDEESFVSGVRICLEAKMRDAKTSVALYAVSSDIDGEKIVQEVGIN